MVNLPNKRSHEIKNLKAFNAIHAYYKENQNEKKAEVSMDRNNTQLLPKSDDIKVVSQEV